MESWIEKYILSRLLHANDQSLKELRPEGVEANLFSYYLKKLVTRGFVARTNHGRYGLTAAGESFVGETSTISPSSNKNVKTVIMFYAKTDKGHLLHRWSRNPYLHKVTPVFDRVHFGDSLQQALERAIKDKFDKQQVACTFRTCGMLRISNGNDLVSHMNCIVYDIDGLDDAEAPTNNGVRLWHDPASVSGAMMGLADLMDAITDKTRPFDCSLVY